MQRQRHRYVLCCRLNALWRVLDRVVAEPYSSKQTFPATCGHAPNSIVSFAQRRVAIRRRPLVDMCIRTHREYWAVECLTLAPRFLCLHD